MELTSYDLEIKDGSAELGIDLCEHDENMVLTIEVGNRDAEYPSSFQFEFCKDDTDKLLCVIHSLTGAYNRLNADKKEKA